MSRIRYIKPGFFVDDDLAACQPLARLLFAGLWTIADREGRLEDRPRRIRAEILPNEDVDTDALLQELADHGSLIVRYEVDGKRYIAIPGWSKHQHPHPRELASAIPEPTEHNLGSAQATPRQCSGTTQARPSRTQVDGDLDLDLNGDLNGDGALRPSSDDNASDVLCGELVTTSSSNDDGFDAFWAQYPRHEARLKAQRAWRRITPDERRLATGIATVMRDLVAKGVTEKRFVPHATTFINGKRWDDWRDGVPATWCTAGAGKAEAAHAEHDAFLRRFAAERGLDYEPATP